MRRVPVPNNNSANTYGVELDKTLKDGSKALGAVEVTSNPSPYKSEDVLFRVNAYQIGPDGRTIQVRDAGGVSRRRGIREMIISVPRSESTVAEIDKLINQAAKLLEDTVDEIPEDQIAQLPPGGAVAKTAVAKKTVKK